MNGDELTLFSPDSGDEEYLVDSENEVHDLRRERKKKKKATEEESSEELTQ